MWWAQGHITRVCQFTRVLGAFELLVDFNDVAAFVEECARLGGTEYAETRDIQFYWTLFIIHDDNQPT